MSDNALAEGAASTSEQTLNAPSSPETPETSQTKPEAKEGAEPTEVKAEPTDKEGSEAEGKKPRSTNDRFREIKRQRDDAEVRAFALQQEIARLRRPIPAKEGMTEVERLARDVRQADRVEQLEEKQESLTEARNEARSTRLQLFSEKVGDQKVVEAFCSLPRVSEELADLVAESDHAKELAARLSNDPQEARRLSMLAPHRLGAELARMEAKFASQPSVRRVSNAPEPSSTLKGGANPPARDVHDKNLSMEEYAAIRGPQLKKARG